jgi:hypothetical protein
MEIKQLYSFTQHYYWDTEKTYMDSVGIAVVIVVGVTLTVAAICDDAQHNQKLNCDKCKITKEI